MLPIEQMNAGNDPLRMNQVAEGQQPALEHGAEGVAQQEEPPRALESLDGKHRITASMFKDGDFARASEAAKGSTLKRVLLGIFTLGIYTAVKHCSRKNLASDVVNLKNELKAFKPGESRTADVKIGGETVSLEQREDGLLTARIDGAWYKVPYTAGQLVDKLERDIVTHPELYGKKAALEVLPDVAMQTQADIDAMFKTGADLGETGANARIRALSLAVLSSRFGIDETKTFGVTTKLLNHYAHQVLLGNVTDKQAFEAAFERVSAGAKFIESPQGNI